MALASSSAALSAARRLSSANFLPPALASSEFELEVASLEEFPSLDDVSSYTTQIRVICIGTGGGSERLGT